MPKPKKILIIDDEADFCFLLKKYLSKKNCEIFLAGTLDAGLELVISERPDIVFLDNNLPDGFGWEKVEYISKQIPGVKLNLISAYQHPMTVIASKNVQILEKPLNFKRLDDFI
jgi:DNA-binding NtrC family response regulator